MRRIIEPKKATQFLLFVLIKQAEVLLAVFYIFVSLVLLWATCHSRHAGPLSCVYLRAER